MTSGSTPLTSKYWSEQDQLDFQRGTEHNLLRAEQLAAEEEEREHNMATGDPVKAAPKPGAKVARASNGKPPRAAAIRDEKKRGVGRSKAAATGEGPLCLCGCGEHTKGGRFRPGHDARYHSAQKAAHETAKPAVAKTPTAPADAGVPPVEPPVTEAAPSAE